MAAPSQAAERLCSLEEVWSGGSCLKELQNIPTQKNLPEDFLQKFYLVVRVSLRIGFFKKSSCVGHWPSINLLGRRELAWTIPSPPWMAPSPPLEGAAPITQHPNPLAEPSDLLMCCLLCHPPTQWSVSSRRMHLSALLHGHLRNCHLPIISHFCHSCPWLAPLFSHYLWQLDSFLLTEIHLILTSVKSNVWCATYYFFFLFTSQETLNY